MRRTKTTLVALCATLALTAGVAAAQSPADRTTFVTFSGPVSLPGMTLPAGTYTFRLADSQTDRHIVQIFNREGTKLFTTLLAVPAQRPEPEGDPVITFKETPADRPPAVHFWYYAGEKEGNELVYPKAQALMIAQSSGEGVMAVDSSGTTIDDWKSGGVSRVTATDTTSSATTASTTSSATTASTTTASTTTASTTTASDTTTTAQPTPAPATPPAATPPAATTPSAATAPATPSVPPPSAVDNDRTVGTSGSLPRTASNMPLVGLIGLLALGGAVAIRVARTA